jgi:hypothetical protein
MRPLNAVRMGTRTTKDLITLKHHALLFDKFYYAQWENPLESSTYGNMLIYGDSEASYRQDYEYLRQQDIVRVVGERDIYDRSSLRTAGLPPFLGEDPLFTKVTSLPIDLRVRNVSTLIAHRWGEDVVPVCQGELQDKLPEDMVTKMQTNVLRIAFSNMPVPGETAAWDDILNFKQEERDKQWAFRRFLLDLSVKKQSESEIRDDFEWSMNEYQKFMKIHRLKTHQSFVETYVIPALETVEDIAKLNFSKIANGVMNVRKRKVELLEAEMRAPGKECAYVFSAQDRFGRL